MSREKVAIDFCISPRMVGVLDHLYGHHGYEFLHLQNLVPGNTADIDWAERYKKFGGRFVISGDSKIAYRPHEAVAFIDNGLICIFPDEAWGKMRGPEQAAFLVYWWPIMATSFKNAPDGSCWRIPCKLMTKDGRELRLQHRPLSPLEIPSHVLDRIRFPKEQGHAG